MKNAAVKNFRISRGMEEDWDLFYKTPDFLDQVIFNTDLIDCHLSEKGVQQVHYYLFSARISEKNLKI